MLVRTYEIWFLVILRILEHFKNSRNRNKSWIPRNCFEDLFKITYIKYILQIFMKAKKNVKKASVNIE